MFCKPQMIPTLLAIAGVIGIGRLAHGTGPECTATSACPLVIPPAAGGKTPQGVLTSVPLPPHACGPCPFALLHVTGQHCELTLDGVALAPSQSATDCRSYRIDLDTGAAICRLEIHDAQSGTVQRRKFLALAGQQYTWAVPPLCCGPAATDTAAAASSCEFLAWLRQKAGCVVERLGKGLRAALTTVRCKAAEQPVPLTLGSLCEESLKLAEGLVHVQAELARLNVGLPKSLEALNARQKQLGEADKELNDLTKQIKLLEDQIAAEITKLEADRRKLGSLVNARDYVADNAIAATARGDAAANEFQLLANKATSEIAILQKAIDERDARITANDSALKKLTASRASTKAIRDNLDTDVNTLRQDYDNRLQWKKDQTAEFHRIEGRILELRNLKDRLNPAPCQ